jgi:hypothetical protein
LRPAISMTPSFSRRAVYHERVNALFQSCLKPVLRRPHPWCVDHFAVTNDTITRPCVSLKKRS